MVVPQERDRGDRRRRSAPSPHSDGQAEGLISERLCLPFREKVVRGMDDVEGPVASRMGSPWRSRALVLYGVGFPWVAPQEPFQSWP